MLGAYSSATYTEVGGFAGVADSAWANREILRIQAVAAPCGWILMHLLYPGEPAALSRAIETHGGHVQNALDGLLAIPLLPSRAERAQPGRDPTTKAFRICFDSTSIAP
jgi:hypothetical protein